MATSGTTAFDLDILDIIEEAYEMTGRVNTSGYDMKTARRSLDLLMREWGNRGINFWTVKEGTTAVTVGDFDISLPSDCIDVLEVSWRTGSGTSQTDSPMNRISVSEWASIANKNNTGNPNSYYVNRLTSPVMYIWPVPSEAATLVYWYLRKIEDTGAYGNTMDVPTRFLPAMTSGLAYYLALKSPAAFERIPLLQGEYERQFRLAEEEDRDRSSTFLVPYMS